MVADKIKAYIKEKNVSQTNLAIMAKIPLDKLNQSLNGRRRFTFEEYCVICFVLNVGVDRFLEPMKPRNRRSKE